MTTPLPLGLAPYLSPLTLLTAPTGMDWGTIPPGDDTTPAQNMAEMWNMCARATSRVDDYCNQVLRATTDIELCHGPDFRVTVGPASGGRVLTPYWGASPAQNARLIMSRWPVLSVTSVQTCPNNQWPRQWTTLPAGYAEPEKPPIGWYGSSSPSGDASGGQAILVGGGYINWCYGRNGWAIQVTYLNGWPHASLTSAVAAGVTSLPVNDCTGWAMKTTTAPTPGQPGSSRTPGSRRRSMSPPRPPPRDQGTSPSRRRPTTRIRPGRSSPPSLHPSSRRASTSPPPKHSPGARPPRRSTRSAAERSPREAGRGT